MLTCVTVGLENPDGLKTVCDVRFDSENKNQAPLVIISHGFKGYKDWGFFPYVCEQLSGRSAITVCSDFSMNGIADPGTGLYNAEIFSKNTVSREIAELKNIISYFRNNINSWHDYWSGKIYLLGHSLGGAVSLIAASEDAGIDGVALWASISDMNRNTVRQKEEWRAKGFLEFTVPATGQTLMLDYGYQQDKDDNKERFDLPAAAGRLECPLLIIHGMQDFTVRPEEAGKLHHAADKSKAELVLIERCNHIFNVTHPMLRTTPQLERALEASMGLIFR